MSFLRFIKEAVSIIVVIYLTDHFDFMTEGDKFEDIVEDFSLKKLGWYLVPKYVEYEANAKWFEYSYIVEFVLKRKTINF